MTIFEVTGNKKKYLPLLLLADEQEDMIDRYLEKGTMYVLEDGGIRAECVVTDEGEGILELKNMAVDPEHQRKGYGKALVNFPDPAVHRAVSDPPGGHRGQPHDDPFL